MTDSRAPGARLPRPVVEVRHQDRHRRRRLGRHPRPRQLPGAHERRQDHRRRGHQEALREPLRQRPQLALLVEAVDVGRQLPGRGVARGGVRLDAPGDDPLEGRGSVRPQLRQRGQGLLLPPGRFLEGRAGAALATAAGEQVVQDQAEGVDVGAVVDRLAPELLRGHVLQRPDDGARHREAGGEGLLGELRPGLLGGIARGGGSGDPEVHDHGLVGAVLDHDVGRLEVPVNDARVVRRDETGDHSASDPHDLFDRESARALLQDRGELDPVDVGHRDVLDAADLPHVVDAHDVGVGDLPGEQELALEALLEVARQLRIGGDLGAHDLDRDPDPELLVPGAVDGAHPAEAEELDDVVPPELLPDLQGTVLAGGPGGGAAARMRREVGRRLALQVSRAGCRQVAGGRFLLVHVRPAGCRPVSGGRLGVFRERLAGIGPAGGREVAGRLLGLAEGKRVLAGGAGHRLERIGGVAVGTPPGGRGGLAHRKLLGCAINVRA